MAAQARRNRTVSECTLYNLLRGWLALATEACGRAAARDVLPNRRLVGSGRHKFLTRPAADGPFYRSTKQPVQLAAGSPRRRQLLLEANQSNLLRKMGPILCESELAHKRN
jgi:hypothetical protein